jgi:hypothetical protein
MPMIAIAEGFMVTISTLPRQLAALRAIGQSSFRCARLGSRKMAA